jgi:hypothetical protein
MHMVGCHHIAEHAQTIPVPGFQDQGKYRADREQKGESLAVNSLKTRARQSGITHSAWLKKG